MIFLARDELLEKGWRRHSIVSSGHGGMAILLPHLPEKAKKIASIDGAIALIATYDCAVVNSCFEDEPWVQILVAFPIEYQKRFAKGRDL